jgi:mRNA interferase MazF
MPTRSLILLEQIRVIDKSRLEAYIGKVEPPVMMRVDKAIAVSLGLGSN